jgi:hypothetical protein
VHDLPERVSLPEHDEHDADRLSGGRVRRQRQHGVYPVPQWNDVPECLRYRYDDVPARFVLDGRVGHLHALHGRIRLPGSDDEHAEHLYGRHVRAGWSVRVHYLPCRLQVSLDHRCALFDRRHLRTWYLVQCRSDVVHAVRRWHGLPVEQSATVGRLPGWHVRTGG